MIEFGRALNPARDEPLREGQGADGKAPVLGHFWYEDADHWFAERLRAEHDPDAADLARQRTLEFLERQLLG